MRKIQMFQLGLLSCAAMGVVSCATSQNYTKVVSSWHGASEHALTQQWGRPTEQKTLSNGNHVDIYHVVQRNRERSGVYWDATPFVRTAPQNSQALVMSHTSSAMRARGDLFYCDTSFVVNKIGMIVNTNYEGNNCVTTQGGVARRAYSVKTE